MNRTKRVSLALLLIFAICGTAIAAEEIVSFHQDIAIQKNSDIKVKETIRINVENISIVHGIKRVFPTERKDTEGRKRPIGFEVEQTLLDGKPVPCSTVYGNGNAIVKIGSADIVIPRGEHTFTLYYIAKGEIGFFDGHDELCWNVTGNGWSFTIRAASCKIQLPDMNFGEGFDKIVWYTGKYGSNDTTGAKLTDKNGVSTIRPLSQGEGLTVVYGWQKGVVEEPLLPTLDDPKAHMVVGILVFAAMLCWLLFAWHKWGKDSQKAIIPLFAAPEGLSPAAVAYADTLKFEGKILLSANIIDMAVKGALTIEQTDGERKLIFKTPVTYILHKKEAEGKKLTQDETKIYEKLFETAEKVVLSEENADILIAAEVAAKSSCRAQLGKLYDNNGKVFSVAALIYTVGVALLWFKSSDEFPVDMFVCGVAGFVSFLLSSRISTSPAEVRFGNFVARILIQSLITLFGLAMVWACENNIMPFMIFSASLFLVTLMRPLMSARNEHGAELYAVAEGLKLYMTTAEKERLEMLNPPEETPQLFEKLLPYALALGVAETWANRFSSVLEAAEYKPQWCSGGMLWLPYDFTHGFGRSIESASVPPSTGQNFGGDWGSGFGGGFSGGGGGGGGGSGW